MYRTKYRSILIKKKSIYLFISNSFLSHILTHTLSLSLLLIIGGGNFLFVFFFVFVGCGVVVFIFYFNYIILHPLGWKAYLTKWVCYAFVLSLDNFTIWLPLLSSSKLQGDTNFYFIYIHTYIHTYIYIYIYAKM